MPYGGKSARSTPEAPNHGRANRSGFSTATNHESCHNLARFRTSFCSKLGNLGKLGNPNLSG